MRALRAPNSRHPKTGLHKSFLPVDLLDALSVDDVLACSQRPEPFEPPSLDGIESGDFLVADWDRAALAVAAKTAAIEQRLHGHADGERKGTVNQLTRSFLAGEVTVGNRHRVLFSAAANLAEIGCPPPAPWCAARTLPISLNCAALYRQFTPFSPCPLSTRACRRRMSIGKSNVDTRGGRHEQG